MLQLGLLLFIVFGLLWVATERPRHIFLVAVFLAPWEGLDIDVGVHLTAFRVVIAFLSVACLLRKVSRPSAKRLLPPSILLGALFIYAVVWSLSQISLLPSAPVEGGTLRSPVSRAILQILMFGLEVSPIFVVPFILHKSLDVWMAGKVYILSCTILAVLGWFQLVCWYSMHWNPLPIGLLTSLWEGGVREGIAVYEGIDLYRMNSLGGEPRNLAGGLVVALILLQMVYVNWNVAYHRRLALIWAFLFLSMLFTLSTSGFVLWIVGTMLLWASTAILKISRMHHLSLLSSIKVQVSLTVATISVMALFVWMTEIHEGINWLEVAEERTIGRDFAEDFDVAVIDFLVDQPSYMWTGVGLGNIHLYANDYLPDYAVIYAHNTAFIAKSGYLKLLSEVGLVGLTLFLMWVGTEIWHLLRIENLCRRFPARIEVCRLAVALAQFGTIMVVFYLLRGSYVVMQTFLTLGFLVTLRHEMSELLWRDLRSKPPTTEYDCSVTIE